MTDDREYIVLEEHEEAGVSRTELRVLKDGGFEMVYMRPRVGGGWYVRNAISLPPRPITKDRRRPPKMQSPQARMRVEVTPAQVEVAQAQVQSDLERGLDPHPFTLLVAQARRLWS